MSPIDIGDLPLPIQKAVRGIPEADCYFIALSGGLDSMALLSFVYPYLSAKSKRVEVIHVHHGLSRNADNWAEHCRRVCAELGVVCHVEYVQVTKRNKGLEAAARIARYSVFDDYLKNGGVLLQGHHLNDQAETILMRLLRGAGPEGLSGIPVQRYLSGGMLYRPWLSTTRADLQREVAKIGAEWIEDESNADCQFDRNYLRHEVIPVLEKRWGACVHDIGRAGDRAQETQAFLTSWCQSNIKQVLSVDYEEGNPVCIEALRRFSLPEQKMLIRYWLDEAGVEQAPERIFVRIWSEMLKVRNDAQPEIRWGAIRIKRFDGCLYLLAKVDIPSFSHSINLKDLPQSLALPNGILSLSSVPQTKGVEVEEGSVVRHVCIPESERQVHVCSRMGSESIKIHGGHSTSLKKLFQASKVPPWKRDGIPLIYIGDDLAFIFSSIVSSMKDVTAEHFSVAKGDNFLRVTFKRSASSQK